MPDFPNSKLTRDWRAVVILSGGLDSTTLLAHMLACDYNVVLTLTLDYGQRHSRELLSAQAISGYYGVPWLKQQINLGVLKSALTDREAQIPEGHYTDESMRATVVPNRNMILLSIAIAAAISRDAGVVAYGAHTGDHAIYADCRPKFFDAIVEAALHCFEDRIIVQAPFLYWSKAQIVSHGTTLGAPLHLTYSCYNGRERHCGKCGTCVERIEAFELANVPDPTAYEERTDV